MLIPLIGISQSAKSSDYYNETYRPQFHFTPEANWMNDPNGLTYLNGKFHLFYQYYPNDIVWGPMHWGHASSKDLFHWEHHPIALFPDSLGSIFSGSAVIDKNNSSGFGRNAMIAIYTYHSDSLWVKGYRNTETQGIAFSLDEGLNWEKYKNNPVIKNSSERDFRDPKVFWNEEIKEWNMVLAVGDRIKIFSSPDLKEWKFKSDFKPIDDLKGLGVWECPDLFKMKINNEEKWILIVNHGDNTPNGGSGTRYFVGDFDGETFTNTQPSIWLDYGTDFYAGVTFYNVPEDKNILISWMSNWMYAQKTPTKKWRSAMTIPRELTLDKNDQGYFLRQKIAGDFNSIKKEVFNIKSIELPFEENDFDFSQAELLFDFDGDEINISLSNTFGNRLEIYLKDKTLNIDRKKSGLIDFSEKFADTVQSMPLNENIYNYQLIFDKTSVEILLNDGKFSMTAIFFPNEKYSALNLSSNNGKNLKNLVINKIKSVW